MAPLSSPTLAIFRAARIAELKMAAQEVARLCRPPAPVSLPSDRLSAQRRLQLLLAAERRRSARLTALLLQ